MKQRRSVGYSTWWYSMSSSYLCEYFCDKDLMIFRSLSRSLLLDDTISHFSYLSSHYRRYLVHCPSTRPYSVLRLMHIFSTLFSLVSYSAFNMAFVEACVVPIGTVHVCSKTFPFRIDVSTSPPPSIFVLSYAFVNLRHSENHPPSFPSLQ